jgi:hypothetical protein
VREKSEMYLSRWADGRGISLVVARKALALGELAALVAARADRREAIDTARRQLERSAMVGADASEVLTADQVEDLTEQVRSNQLADSAYRAEADALAADLAPAVAMDQHELLALEPDAIRALAGRLLPPDKAAEAKALRALVALQGEWIERVGRGSEFQGAFLQQCHVVAGTCVGLAGVRGMRELQFDLCIIDEASKATATEALVPIVRAGRWVLVGDTRQLPPFQEEALQDPSLSNMANANVAIDDTQVNVDARNSVALALTAVLAPETTAVVVTVDAQVVAWVTRTPAGRSAFSEFGVHQRIAGESLLAYGVALADGVLRVAQLSVQACPVPVLMIKLPRGPENVAH